MDAVGGIVRSRDKLDEFVEIDLGEARDRHADLSRRLEEFAQQWADFLKSVGRDLDGESEEDRRRRTLRRRDAPVIRYRVG